MATETRDSANVSGPVLVPKHAGQMIARRRGLDEKQWFGLQLIVPAVLVLCIFEIMPIAIGANASFRNWTLYDPNGAWVGFRHYAYILSDPVFLKLVLPNTFLLIVLSVSFSLCLGLALAHLLIRQFVGRTIVQTFVLLPLLVAPVIASMMVRWIFNDQFGIAAAVLAALGIGPDFLAGRALARLQPHRLHRYLALDAVVHDHPACSAAGAAEGALRGRTYRRGEWLAHLHPYHPADAAAGHGRLHRGSRDRLFPDVRSGLGHHQRRPGAHH